MDLSDNKLKTLPDSIGNLRSLETFILPHNRIEHLPESFGKLSSLKNFDIFDNYLVEISESFCELSNLRELFIEWNNLIILPRNFGKLKSLEFLNVAHNKISFLPDSFKELTNLIEVGFENNELSRIPPSFRISPQMSYFSFFNNPIRSLHTQSHDFFNILLQTYFDRQNLHLIKVLKRYPNQLSFGENFLSEIGQELLNQKNSQGMWEYYKKSQMELAQNFIDDNNSLSESEMGRLLHELGINERRMLEENLKIDHPIFSKISQNEKIKLKDGIEIMK
ncbi:hypothetical protein ES708_09324 [subsurface metagenome]